LEICSSAACFSGPCERTPRKCSRAPAPPSAGRCRSRFRCRVGLRASRRTHPLPRRLSRASLGTRPAIALKQRGGFSQVGWRHTWWRARPVPDQFCARFRKRQFSWLYFPPSSKVKYFHFFHFSTLPLFHYSTFPPRSAADARGSATTRTVRVGGSAGPPTAARPRG
jgi:hypothetical protein